MPDFTIAITFALPTESLDLRRRLRHVRQDRYFVSGKINERPITILHTGVGTQNCSARMEALLHKVQPRLVVSSGFAGAIGGGLKAGDLIIAENFSDRKLLEAATQSLRAYSPHAVKLFTSSSIIDSTAERNEIARASGAAAVDMETGTIAEICNAHAMPVLSLRAISDTSDRPFPAPPDVLFDLERQQTNYGRLFTYLLTHPASISGLLKFGREINQARAKLTDAIVAVVRAL